MFKEANVLVTDGEDSYRSLEKSESLLHEQVISDEHVKGNFNLGDINGLHSKLNMFWPAKLGRSPSTKYMDLEIMLFWWLEKNSNLTTREKVEKLYKEVSSVIGNTEYEDIPNRELSLNTKGLIPKSLIELLIKHLEV